MHATVHVKRCSENVKAVVTSTTVMKITSRMRRGGM